jgi:GDP-L-fucose synthase
MTIIVAGHTGLVGSAIYELLKSQDEEAVGINSKVVNLLDRQATFDFINDHKPSIVIDAAAIVGGIGANNSFPVDFLSKNLQIQNNLMDASHAANVERFIFLGSSCIYPRECRQPIREEYLLTGPLESTNSAYAIAKIAGIELIKSYRKQFNRRWISLMTTNMYGHQ